MAKVKVFFSYARQDYELVTPLFHQFSGLVKSTTHHGKRYSIEYYWDELTTPGEDWDKTIKWKLIDADVVVFFVTKNFLSSDYIQKYEIPLAIQRNIDSGISLLPVLIEACDYNKSKIKHLQFVANYKGYLKPMQEWYSKNKFWEYLRFALRLSIKCSLEGIPDLNKYDNNYLSPADRKKRIELFAPPEVLKLIKLKKKKRKTPSKGKKRGFWERMKVRLKI